MKPSAALHLVRLTTAVLLGALATPSCRSARPIAAAQLQEVVARDAVAFEPERIPGEVLDELASHRVVLLGETHFLREHRELVTRLLRGLHARGFRQLLFEWTQVVDWLMDDFVLDGGMEPGWSPPADIGGAMITAIRDFNRTLPEGERIRVRPIDVTLPDYGGDEAFVASMGMLARHLSNPGPLPGFLQGSHGTAERRTGSLESLQAGLHADRPGLVASWGSARYETIVEMVEVELASVPIRAIRERNYDRSVRLREDMIKRLVDRRLAGYPHGTIINIGCTHAQKQRLWGTRIEWLGEHLAHRNQPAGKPVIAIAVAAARIVSVAGSGIPDQDLRASPENEVLRMMHQTRPDQGVFLALDDPVFSNGKIPLNREGEIYVGPPGRHFDALILLPVAHRVPLGP